jgi:hypothetical protein
MPLFSSVLSDQLTTENDEMHSCSKLLAGLARVVQVGAAEPIQTFTRTRTRGHPHALETGNRSKKPRRRGSKGLNAAILANHYTNRRANPRQTPSRSQPAPSQSSLPESPIALRPTTGDPTRADH